MHNPAAFLELNNALRELDRMVGEVPLDQPWKAPKAREWDSMTFAEWCRKNVWTE
jgi:monoamine oxidase